MLFKTQYNFSYSDCRFAALPNQLAHGVGLMLEISYLHSPAKSKNILKYSLNFTAMCNNKMTSRKKNNRL